jgi:hypothetical protein
MTAPVRVLGEYSLDNGVKVIGLDEDGFVVNEVLLGYANNEVDAENMLGDNNWTCEHGVDVWFEGNGCRLLDIFPKPIIVTVVGSEIPYTDEELVEQVRQNGVPEAMGVGNKIPSEGKFLVTISLDKPRGWSWQ